MANYILNAKYGLPDRGPRICAQLEVSPFLRWWNPPGIPCIYAFNLGCVSSHYFDVEITHWPEGRHVKERMQMKHQSIPHRTHSHVLPRTYSRMPESTLTLELITTSYLYTCELVYYPRFLTWDDDGSIGYFSLY